MSKPSAARIPGSLRNFRTAAASGVVSRPIATPSSKSEVKAKTVLAAACLVAAPLQGAFAQQAPSTDATPLPPVTVESKQAPKKQAPAAAPQPAPTQAAPLLPEQKSANPYANPNAPYKVESSGSNKFTEPLVNTPKTVTTIPKEVIKDTGATSLRDLARQTPGVVLGFAEGGNAFGDSIYIRGFNARNDIYVDGMRDVGNTSRETFATEQIEIYKGPGSAVSGRGTPGGALNIITKKPNETNNFYNLSTTFGTDGQKRVTADVNQVLNPGVAVRANVLWHDSDVAGRDFAHDNRWGGQFAVTVKPTSDFKYTIDYYHYRTKGIPDYGVPINTTTKVPWTENGVSRNTWYGIATRDFMKNNVDTVTGTAEWKLAPGITLSNKTRYGETLADYIATTPRATSSSTVTTGVSQRRQDTTMVGNQTDLTFKFTTGEWKHTLVSGVEASSERMTRYAYSGLTTSTVSLYDPDEYRASSAYTEPTFSYRATIDTKSAYILDTVKLNEQWMVNGGIRVDNYNRTQIAATSANTASREDTLLNWHAGIVFKPIPIASLYVAYATASNPSGGELDSTGVAYGGLTAGTAILNPEQTTGVEVGTKWELFDKRLLATAALFQTDKTNARENSSTCDTTTLTCTAADTGGYRVRGVEFGVQGNIDKYWSIYGGVVFLQTEVTKSAYATMIGRRLANIPLQQFSLLSKYKVTDALTVGGQATYSGEAYNGYFAAADDGYHIPAHWRFDLLSEYKFDKHFSVQLNVLNVTNELYYDALYQSAGSFAFVAPGRAGYLTLSWKY